jgi:hypothetical protein
MFSHYLHYLTTSKLFVHVSTVYFVMDAIRPCQDLGHLVVVNTKQFNEFDFCSSKVNGWYFPASSLHRNQIKMLRQSAITNEQRYPEVQCSIEGHVSSEFGRIRRKPPLFRTGAGIPLTFLYHTFVLLSPALPLPGDVLGGPSGSAGHCSGYNRPGQPTRRA